MDNRCSITFPKNCCHVYSSLSIRAWTIRLGRKLRMRKRDFPVERGRLVGEIAFLERGNDARRKCRCWNGGKKNGERGTRRKGSRFASRLAAHHRASTSFFLGNRWSGFVVDEDLSGLGGLASEAADPRLLKSARGGCRSSNFQRARQFVTPLQNARERKTRPILTVQR